MKLLTDSQELFFMHLQFVYADKSPDRHSATMYLVKLYDYATKKIVRRLSSSTLFMWELIMNIVSNWLMHQ